MNSTTTTYKPMIAKAYFHDSPSPSHPSIYLFIQKADDFNPRTDAGIYGWWDDIVASVKVKIEIPSADSGVGMTSPLWISNSSCGTAFLKGDFSLNTMMNTALNSLNMLDCMLTQFQTQFQTPNKEFLARLGYCSNFECMILMRNLIDRLASKIDKELQKSEWRTKQYTVDEVENIVYNAPDNPNRESGLSRMAQRQRAGLRIGRYGHSVQFTSNDGRPVWQADFTPRQEFRFKPNARPKVVAITAGERELKTAFMVLNADCLTGIANGILYQILGKTIVDGKLYYRIKNDFGNEMCISSSRGKAVLNV